jgi:putative glutathione S-transferase
MEMRMNMGLLIDGVWRDQWYDTKSTGGAFKRQDAQFRNWVTPDGAPGPSGDGGFAAESDATTSTSAMPVPGRIAR